MGVLVGLKLKVDKINQEKIFKGKKHDYYDVTLSINDKTSDFGTNVSLFESQTPEEREAKKERNYIGEGKVFWTDGKVEVAKPKKKEGGSPHQAYSEPQGVIDSNDDLPF